jgi:hypothetical protein
MRRLALERWREKLVDGGTLALHVHNVWHGLADSWGRRSIARMLAGSLLPGREFGDSWIHGYCGLECLYLHLFSWRELRKLLRRTGFEIQRAVFLDDERTGPLRGRRRSLRCNGFLVAAVKAPRRGDL